MVVMINDSFLLLTLLILLIAMIKQLASKRCTMIYQFTLLYFRCNHSVSVKMCAVPAQFVHDNNDVNICDNNASIFYLVMLNIES